MKQVSKFAAAAAIIAGFTMGAAHATPIPGLVNTGAGLSDGQADTNYQVISTPAADGPSSGATAVVGGGFPFPYWVTPPAGSNWISAYGRNPNLDPSADGTYDYRLSFFLTNSATSLTITGDWATDNYGSAILLNGLNAGVPAAGLSTLTPFTITGTAPAGWNYLDFEVTNYAQDGGNPTGLLVTNLAGTYTPDPVPEPASLGMLAAGLAALGFMRFRRA